MYPYKDHVSTRGPLHAGACDRQVRQFGVLREQSRHPDETPPQALPEGRLLLQHQRARRLHRQPVSGASFVCKLFCLSSVITSSVGNRLDFHNRSSVSPNRSVIGCIIGSWDAILRMSAHGRWDEGYRSKFA